ncbi:hypothetical protein RCL1_007096 [Eukaryota sp. TZLM3-RCL]
MNGLENSPIKRISPANISVGEDFIQKLAYEDDSFADDIYDFPIQVRLSGDLTCEFQPRVSQESQPLSQYASKPPVFDKSKLDDLKRLREDKKELVSVSPRINRPSPPSRGSSTSPKEESIIEKPAVREGTPPLLPHKPTPDKSNPPGPTHSTPFSPPTREKEQRKAAEDALLEHQNISKKKIDELNILNIKLKNQLEIQTKRAIEAEQSLLLHQNSFKLKEDEFLITITKLKENYDLLLKEQEKRPKQANLNISNSSRRIRELETKLAAANSQIAGLNKKINQINQQAIRPPPPPSHPQVQPPSNPQVPPPAPKQPPQTSPQPPTAPPSTPDPTQALEESLIIKRLRTELDDVQSRYSLLLERSSRSVRTLEHALSERDAEVTALRARVDALNVQTRTLAEQIGVTSADAARDFRVFEMKNEERISQVKDHYCEEIRRIRSEHLRQIKTVEEEAEGVHSSLQKELVSIRHKLRDQQIARTKAEQRVTQLEADLEVLKVNPVVASVCTFIDRIEHVQKSLINNHESEQSKIDQLFLENEKISNLLLQKSKEVSDLRHQLNILQQKLS